jgi:hypothetical protein
MRRESIRVALVALVACALVAACGGSDDGGTSTATTRPSTATTAGEATATTTAGGADVAELLTGPPALPECADGTTASADGVTADTVNLGVLYIDTSKLVDIGFAIDPGPIKDTYETLLEAPNANGGICGRMIEGTVYLFDGLTPGDDSKGCSTLTEDTKQFMVFAGGGIVTAALQCLADQGDTVTLTDISDIEAFAAALDGRLFSTGHDRGPTLRTVAQILDDESLLGGKVGLVYGGTPELEDAMEQVLQPALEERGVDLVTCPLPSGSAAETSAAIPLCAEKFVSAGGVTTVLLGINEYASSLFANESAKQGLDPKYINVQGFACCGDVPKLMFNKVSTPALFDGLVSTVTALSADPDSAYTEQCLGRIEQLALTPAPKDMTSFQRRSMVQLCATVDVLHYAVGAAGAEPTQDSLIKAMENTPPFRSPFGVAGSWGPQKHYFTDELYLETYDAESDSFNRLTDRAYPIAS